MSEMPDRAVVDHGSPCPDTKDGIWPHSWGYCHDANGEQECLRCGAVTIPENWTPRCPRCGDDMKLDSAGRWQCGNHLLADDEPPPRALVALSEDRQWLVVHHLGTGFWQVLDICHWGYQEYASVEDTGQSADAVLADWLARHDGG